MKKELLPHPRLFVCICFLLISAYMKAQDVVTMKDGSTLTCNVVEVNENNISVKQEGVVGNTIIPITDIMTITYKNGDKETFGETQKQTQPEPEVTESPKEEVKPFESNKETNYNVKSEKANDKDSWIPWYITYSNTFKNNNKGSIGIGFEGVKIDGFGMNLSFETGIENPFDVFMVNAGVNYSIGVGKDNKAAFTIPLMLNCLKKYPENSTKAETYWGISTCPELSFKLTEKIYFKLGCLLSYSLGKEDNKEIQAQALLGIGIEF